MPAWVSIYVSICIILKHYDFIFWTIWLFSSLHEVESLFVFQQLCSLESWFCVFCPVKVEVKHDWGHICKHQKRPEWNHSNVLNVFILSHLLSLSGRSMSPAVDPRANMTLPHQVWSKKVTACCSIFKSLEINNCFVLFLWFPTLKKNVYEPILHLLSLLLHKNMNFLIYFQEKSRKTVTECIQIWIFTLGKSAISQILKLCNSSKCTCEVLH